MGKIGLFVSILLLFSICSAQDTQSWDLFSPYYSNYVGISAHELHTGASTGIRIKEFVSIGAFGSLDHINNELYYGGYARSKFIRNPYVVPALSVKVGEYANRFRAEILLETLIRLGQYVRIEPCLGLNDDVLVGEFRIVVGNFNE